jgi:Rap1a immunity proteins
MKLLFGTLLALAAAVGSAHAERFSAIDGSRLITICTGRDKGVVADCTAYINGVSDAVSFYQNLRPADGSKGGRLPAYICVPTAITGVQLREAVVGWAKSHPESQRLQASGVVLRALHDTFKCQGTEGGLSS